MKNRLFYLFIAALTVSSPFACGGKPKTDVADTITIITLVSGDVKITGSNTAREAKVGDRIIEKESVKTGKESIAVVQIGSDSIVQVQADSEFCFDKISVDERTTELRKGGILCKISRLSRIDGFKVQSPNIKAAVRGTQFSVTYTGKSTTVGVREGKVAVITAKEKDFTSANVIEPGFTGFTTEKPDGSVKIETREISEEEETVLLKIKDTLLIPEIDKKTSEEIKNIMGSSDNKSGLEAKQKTIIQRQSGSLAEIKNAFNRLDEITLYSNRVIRGIIISRGQTFVIVTPNGKLNISAGEIKNTKVIR